MLNFLKTVVFAALGVALGLAATWASVERGLGFGAVRAGPWTAWPRSGSPEADPYARAVLSKTGEVPLGLGEGLTFTATTDSTGAALLGSCGYDFSGPVPPARYWTLTAATPDGRLIGNAANRYGFTSAEIVRQAGGTFSIAVARDVQPGNWLPLGNAETFQLVLRLYDTPVSATASALGAKTMPAIARTECP